MALTPAAHDLRFLFMPVLAGATMVVVMGWAVHVFEITLLRRLEQSRKLRMSEEE